MGVSSGNLFLCILLWLTSGSPVIVRPPKVIYSLHIIAVFVWFKLHASMSSDMAFAFIYHCVLKTLRFMQIAIITYVHSVILTTFVSVLSGMDSWLICS